MVPNKDTLVFVLVLTSLSHASVLQDALEEHLKDVAHDEEAQAVKHDNQKGEKIHNIENQVKDVHQNQYSKANDDAKYLTQDRDEKASSESDAYKGHNAQQDKAEDSQSNGFKRGHKKGHHKQGFQNSYHKDESSNKSTFFDDLNDEGDQAGYNSRLNSHDNQGGRNYQGSHRNGQEYIKDNSRVGGYNRYGDHGNKIASNKDYGKKYYLDDVANHNKYRNGYNNYDRSKIHDRREFTPPIHHDRGWQGWDERRDWDRNRGWEREPGWQREQGWQADPGWQRDPGWQEPAWQQPGGWERDYGGPGYYDDRGFRHEGGYGYGPQHGYGYGYGESRNDPVAEVPKNAPVVAHRKQTITIYEDPRYDKTDKGKLRREEGDYLQLDFKPSSQRYAAYDDTYYAAAPARQGAESSNINRLVYNYRRQ